MEYHRKWPKFVQVDDWWQSVVDNVYQIMFVISRMWKILIGRCWNVSVWDVHVVSSACSMLSLGNSICCRVIVCLAFVLCIHSVCMSSILLWEPSSCLLTLASSLTLSLLLFIIQPSLLLGLYISACNIVVWGFLLPCSCICDTQGVFSWLCFSFYNFCYFSRLHRTFYIDAYTN